VLSQTNLYAAGPAQQCATASGTGTDLATAIANAKAAATTAAQALLNCVAVYSSGVVTASAPCSSNPSQKISKTAQALSYNSIQEAQAYAQEVAQNAANDAAAQC